MMQHQTEQTPNLLKELTFFSEERRKGKVD
jgi:hypothetical protein